MTCVTLYSWILFASVEGDFAYSRQSRCLRVAVRWWSTALRGVSPVSIFSPLMMTQKCILLSLFSVMIEFERA